MRSEQSQLENMKFDDQHYHRAYHMCMGRGGTEEQCRNIPVDTHITPQNPLPTAFPKETLDAIECMSEHGDASKCYHYTEYFHKRVNYEAPEPGKFAKVSALASRAGWSLAWAPIALGVLKYVKIA